MEKLRKNLLTDERRFALARYLSTIEERLKGEGPTYREVAEWASKALEFPVTESNVEHVSGNAHVTWEIRRPPAKPRPGAFRICLDRIAALDTRIAELEDDAAETVGRLEALGAALTVQRQCLARLCNALGVPEAPLDAFDQARDTPAVTKPAPTPGGDPRGTSPLFY